MINIDGNLFAKKDLWLDLRNGLPFPDQSVCFVYSCHTLEHLIPDEASTLLKEIHRVLAPSGSARIVVPSFEYALKISNGAQRSDWPRRFRSPSAQAINYLFCDGQHAYAYSLELMEEFVREAGFPKILSSRIPLPEEDSGELNDPMPISEEPIGSLVVELER